MELVITALLLAGLGAIAGVLAGLLGIGGGVVLVPGLYYILSHYGYEENAMHLAVGTSLLTIVLTGTSSAYAHYKKNAIDFTLLKSFLPGVILGVIAGTLLANIFESNGLKAVFASSQIIFGSYMLLSTQKTALFSAMPRRIWIVIISAANACLATLMGVGGGVQNVVFMTICNVAIHRAVATAAAIGPFIAAMGAAGFVTIGMSDPSLPPYSLGYLNIPAFLCIIATSMLTAPIGAKIAHNAPVKTLKRYFAGFMLIVAAKMLAELFF